MTADKYLIVSLDHVDYAMLIRAKGLPPGSCFQCESPAEALYTAERNAEWGIPVTILHTPEWRAKHPSVKEHAA